jgi:membrane fusion protein (multidrug efflux system)
MLKREPVAGARLATWPLKVWFGSTFVQRVPVRIALEGDGAKLDVLRPGLSVIVTVNEKRF